MNLIDDFGRDGTLQKQTPVQLNQLQGELRQLKKVCASGQLIVGIAHDLDNLLQDRFTDSYLIMKQSAFSGDVETRVKIT